MTRLCRSLLLLMVAWLCVLSMPSSAQEDALSVQQRAIARIDTIIDLVRKTGDWRNGLSEFMQADRELAASNAFFATSNDWGPLALGLMKQGTLRRIAAQWAPDQWAPALSLYRQAAGAAHRAGSVAYQADALAWVSSVEISMNNIAQASSDAKEALRLAGAVTAAAHQQ